MTIEEALEWAEAGDMNAGPRTQEALKWLAIALRNQRSLVSHFEFQAKVRADDFAKLREALEETNKWLDGHIVLVGGDESPAEPADSFSSEAVSMITANNRALGKF